MTIKKPSGQVISEIVTLKEYFGMKEGQTLSTFMAEVRALTPEAKSELALGAAKELGYTVE